MRIYREVCKHINDIERERIAGELNKYEKPSESWIFLMNRMKGAQLKAKLTFLLLNQIVKEDRIVEPPSIGGDWMLYRWNNFLNLLRSDEKIKHLMAKDPIFKDTLDKLKIDKLDFDSDIMEKYFEQVEKIKEKNNFKKMKKIYSNLKITYTTEWDNYYEC